MKMNWYAFPSQVCFMRWLFYPGYATEYILVVYIGRRVSRPLPCLALPCLALGGHGKRGRVRVLPRVGLDKTCRLLACWVCVCVCVYFALGTR